jgi:hypothetical protein
MYTGTTNAGNPRLHKQRSDSNINNHRIFRGLVWLQELANSQENGGLQQNYQLLNIPRRLLDLVIK